MLFPIDIKNEESNIVDFCEEILELSLTPYQRIIATTIYNDTTNLNPAEYLYMKSNSNFQEENYYCNYGFTLPRGQGKTHLLSAMLAYEVWNMFYVESAFQQKTILFYYINEILCSHTSDLIMNFLNIMGFTHSQQRRNELTIEFRSREVNIIFSSCNSRILRGINPHVIYYDNCFFYPEQFFISQHQFFPNVTKRVLCDTSGFGNLSDIFDGLYLNF